jgi:hypothetical protein
VFDEFEMVMNEILLRRSSASAEFTRTLGLMTPSPNPEPVLVRESSSPE